MKKVALIFLISPVFMAMQCDDDLPCGVSRPATYRANVENISESYSTNDTIWVYSSVSANLIDFCTTTQDSVLVTSPADFKEALFVVKMTQPQSGINSVIASSDFDFVYDKAQPSQPNFCLNGKQFLPILNNNLLRYEFRVGIVPKNTGDYCLTFAYGSAFVTDIEKNLEIFKPYNLENAVTFDTCGDNYTRLPEYEQTYFFKVQ